MDTIFALATAPGRSGVAVVRVSGPRAGEVCLALAGRMPEARRATLCRLVAEDDPIDEALVIRFPAGESFTGEEVVEFQTHGSPAVVARLLKVLSAIDGLRAAEAGEFTRRALENGRMDLAEVEGLADLLDAETEAQRRQAFHIFDGRLGRKVEEWRAQLLRAAALTEASIDFADEDVLEDVTPEVANLIKSLLHEFGAEVDGIGAAEQLRSGFEVAIIGPPNAGKSTLLNRLAGREAAITSEYAGTTRDVIEVRMDIDGLPVTFLDTAGLRETSDPVELIGVERAVARANAADLRIILGEGIPAVRIGDEDLVLAPKADLGETSGRLGISGLTGQGVSALLEHVGAVLGGRLSATRTATRLRHGEALRGAIVALERARQSLQSGDCDEELVAEELRSAIRAIDSIVGRIGVEDILGEIFSSFCIGK